MMITTRMMMPEGKNTEQLKAKPRTPKVPSQTLLTRAVVRNRLSSDFWKKIGKKKRHKMVL